MKMVGSFPITPSFSVKEMNEKFVVKARATAGESTFSNGVVERHRRILSEAI